MVVLGSECREGPSEEAMAGTCGPGLTLKDASRWMEGREVGQAGRVRGKAELRVDDKER